MIGIEEGLPVQLQQPELGVLDAFGLTVRPDDGMVFPEPGEFALRSRSVLTSVPAGEFFPVFA